MFISSIFVLTKKWLFIFQQFSGWAPQDMQKGSSPISWRRHAWQEICRPTKTSRNLQALRICQAHLCWAPATHPAKLRGTRPARQAKKPSRCLRRWNLRQNGPKRVTSRQSCRPRRSRRRRAETEKSCRTNWTIISRREGREMKEAIERLQEIAIFVRTKFLNLFKNALNKIDTDVI